MSNIDMCSHDWPGTGCRECMREAHKAKVSKLEDRLLDEIESKMLAEAELHKAAELALKAETRIEELEASNKVNAEDCNEAEQILRNIIKEWSCSGDVFGAIQQAREFLK